MSRTVIVILFNLHVLHRLYVDTFEDPKPFNGSFEEMCQEKSVPNLLLALVNMVLEGPSIKDQIRESSTPAALSIAQILKYNSVKHTRTQADTSSSVRHTTAQEMPLPIYIANAAGTNLNNEFNPICSCRYLTTNSSSHESMISMTD